MGPVMQLQSGKGRPAKIGQITAVSVPQGIDLDWRYHDEHIHELFLRYIQFINADLIHFHSIQRLTASVMDVASKLKIPHVVTLHDSWWLCDRQFMINNNQLDCEQYQVDPLVCSKCLDDNNNSILRRLSLSEKLNKADKLLGVSDYQCSLYINNGFESVSLHKNGIVKNEISANCPKTAGGSKNLENRGKLKLAYVGGICVHKGYYFLKSVIENLFLENCEFILVDLNLSNKEERQEKWGKNVIKFIGKIDFDKMIEFYQDIDVLLVPSMWRESFGLISREALVQGVWVVASNSGGLVEDIIPGINGDIFEKSNIEQFEKILLEIEANPEKYKNIGMARKGTEDIVSMKDNVDELVSIYRTLLK